MVKKPRCPYCQCSELYHLVYGLVIPDEDPMTDEYGNECKLMGCSVMEQSPDWECRACGQRFKDEDITRSARPSPRNPQGDPLQNLICRLVEFRDARDWEQFHTPGNLASALTVEAAELQELFLWKQQGEVEEALKDEDIRIDAEREIADVLIYSLLFCHTIGADPVVLIERKLEENAEKYPVDQARGRADKYTELGKDDE